MCKAPEYKIYPYWNFMGMLYYLYAYFHIYRLDVLRCLLCV